MCVPQNVGQNHSWPLFDRKLKYILVSFSIKTVSLKHASQIDLMAS